MDDDKKKQVMIGVAVFCIIAAGGIFFLTHSGGGTGVDSIPDSEKMWVKCNNPACGAEYQLPAKKVYKFLQENVNPLANSEPAMVCEKCGEKSVYRAEKCENCGKVFFLHASGVGDYADRCPYCQYSAEEAKRKARMSGQQTN